MSEYQYYEFLALDRPLTDEQQRALRACSSRATITATRFQNDYSWGDLRGDPDEWMEKYFDAFVYVASWGTRRLSLRVPVAALEPGLARRYCCDDAVTVRRHAGNVIVDFALEEEGGDWVDGENGWMAALAPLREELLSGDLRPLYLGWLAAVGGGGVDETEAEPPCPAGLANLSAAQVSLAEFLKIDPDLLAAAEAGSAPLEERANSAELAGWIERIADAEKNALLVAVAEGSGARVRGELLRRYRAQRAETGGVESKPRRTAGDLLEAAGAADAERARLEQERETQEHARLAREAEARRERELAALAKREADAWREVEALIATKLASRYDTATALLKNLVEVCRRAGREAEANRRVCELRDTYARRSALIERLDRAGLGAPRPR